MATGARVDSNLNDTVFRVPLVCSCRSHPTVAYERSVRTSVYIHVHRVLLCLIEVLRIDDHRREGEAVRGLHMHKLTKGVLGFVVVRSLHIRNHSRLVSRARRRKVRLSYQALMAL